MTDLDLILTVTGEDGVSWDYRPNVNVSPGTILPILDFHDGKYRIVPATWGFIPHWSKTDKPATRPPNATCEALESNGMWKYAFKNARAVTETDGFFEWDQNFPKGERPAYWIRRRDRRATLMACVEAERRLDDEHVQRTTAVITTEPNELVQRLHHRQPVFLEPDEIEEWLDPARSPEQLARFFQPSPSELYEAVPIGPGIGSVKNKAWELLEPTGEILRV